MFVWSGADVCGQEFEAVREACGGIFSGAAGSRYPYAPVVFLKVCSAWWLVLTAALLMWIVAVSRGADVACWLRSVKIERGFVSDE